MKRIAPYWKAVLGFVTPGAVIIGSSVLETSDGGTTITSAEWVAAIVAMIVTGGAVYAVPNEPVHEAPQYEGPPF